MNDSRRAASAPTWLKAVIWSLAIGIAVLGAVLAVATGSLWPLLAFAGLALPMVPVGTPRSSNSARETAH